VPRSLHARVARAHLTWSNCSVRRGAPVDFGNRIERGLRLPRHFATSTSHADRRTWPMTCSSRSSTTSTCRSCAGAASRRTTHARRALRRRNRPLSGSAADDQDKPRCRSQYSKRLGPLDYPVTPSSRLISRAILTQHRGGGCAERDHHVLDDRRRAAARGVRASNLNGSLYGCKARRTDGDVIRACGSKDRTSGGARKARLHWTADVDGGGQTATAGDGRRDGERDGDGLGTRQRKTLGAAARNERQQEYQRLNDSH